MHNNDSGLGRYRHYLTHKRLQVSKAEIAFCSRSQTNCFSPQARRVLLKLHHYYSSKIHRLNLDVNMINIRETI